MEVLLIGAFGGIANEVLHWYGLRKKSTFPKYARNPLYWLITVFMILVGAGFAFIQLGPGADNLLLPFELGLLAPIILKKAIANNGTPGGSMSVQKIGEPTFAEFIKG